MQQPARIVELLTSPPHQPPRVRKTRLLLSQQELIQVDFQNICVAAVIVKDVVYDRVAVFLNHQKHDLRGLLVPPAAFRPNSVDYDSFGDPFPFTG